MHAVSPCKPWAITLDPPASQPPPVGRPRTATNTTTVHYVIHSVVSRHRNIRPLLMGCTCRRSSREVWCGVLLLMEWTSPWMARSAACVRTMHAQDYWSVQIVVMDPNGFERRVSVRFCPQMNYGLVCKCSGHISVSLGITSVYGRTYVRTCCVMYTSARDDSDCM